MTVKNAKKIVFRSIGITPFGLKRKYSRSGSIICYDFIHNRVIAIEKRGSKPRLWERMIERYFPEYYFKNIAKVFSFPIVKIANASRG